MTVDWGVLAAGTSTYDVLDCQTDPAGNTTDVVAVGLRLTLSEVAAKFTAGHANSLLVYADTLDIDVAELPAAFNVIVARSVGTTGPVGLPAPSTTNPTTVTEILTTSALTLTTVDGHRFPVPKNTVPTASSVIVTQGEDPKLTTATDPATIGDLTGRPYALNALHATFSAATRLANTTDGGPIARDMLAWITQVTTSATTTATDPTPWTELYDQAQPLLISLMVQPGALYVPSLSSAYYQNQLGSLLDTLDSYDASLNTLSTSSDIAKAVAAVAATTTSTAADELTPLQTELDSLNANLNDLNTGIRSLNLQFEMQQSSVEAAYAQLEVAIVEAQIKAWFNACIGLAVKAIGLGFDAMKLKQALPATPKGGDGGGEDGGGEDGGDGDDGYGGSGDESPLVSDDDEPIILDDDGDDQSSDDEGGPGAGGSGDGGGKDEKRPKPGATIGPTKAVVVGAIGIAQDAISAIQAVAKRFDGARPLVERSANLVQMQNDMIVSYYQSADRADVLDDPPPVMTAIDSDTSWNNYLTQVQTALGSVKGSGPLVVALSCLVNFGKALDAKIATATGLYAQRRIVLSRTAALQSAQARWNDLKTKSQSDQERLAALRGLLQERVDAIDRSVFVAWQSYANAYAYLYFTRPPVTIDLDMDTASLRRGVAAVGSWVGRLQSGGSNGQQIALPNNRVRIELTFPIADAQDLAATADAARLWPALDSRPAFLSWNIAIGTDQLRGVLPDSGKVAVWISDAAFFVVGAAGNARGNLLAQVTTSGSYQNGFGPDQAHRFVTRPMAGNFAYQTSNSRVYNPWKVPTNVLMTPTPFTQWTLALLPEGGSLDRATQLRMQLTVSYREAQ